MMNPQFKTALLRGLILGVISAGVAFFATLGSETEVVVRATGSAFFAPLAARFLGEGTIDARRAKKGKVQPGDVTAGSP